jgi:hypothetical protein
MPINGFLYPGAKVVKAYNVANSIIYNDGDGPQLTRVNSSDGNLKNFTFSVWVKRSSGGATKRLLHCRNSGGSQFASIFFNSSDQLEYSSSDGSNSDNLVTNRLFRDFSAWYNIVVVWDSDNSTSSDRIKFFVNGSRETSFATSDFPALNQESMMSKGTAASTIGLGYQSVANSEHFDGYMCEAVFLDGTASTDASEFGEFDEDSPTIWKPKDVSGLTFGSHGYYLDFEDSSALGDDVSGNNNDFTPNANFASTDQSTDTCTNNFATYNALLSQVAGVDGRHSSWNGQLAEGNLSSGTAVDIYNNQFSTFGLTSGKWYAEFKMSTTDNNFSHGIVNDVFFSNLGSYIGQSTASGVRNIGYYSQNGQVLKNNSAEYTGSSYGSSSADLISIALDLDNNFVYFAKNGTYQNSGDPTSGSSGTGGVAVDADTTWFLGSTTHSLSSSGLKISYANFGSPPTGFTISSGNADANGHGNFEYSVPSGYFALCSKNLAEFG